MRFGKNIRYTMFMGADIAQGLSEAAQLNRRKSNLFGLGYEGDEKVTAGCSFKGRLWAHKVAFDLSDWVEWCNHVGRKLLDETINTNEVFAHVIRAKRINERPPLVPIMISWPEEFQEKPEEMVDIDFGAGDIPFFECDIEVANYADSGPLSFAIVSGTSRATFELAITETGAAFTQIEGPVSYAKLGRNRKTLADWFNFDPPIVHFGNGDFLVYNELFELPRGDQRLAYDRNKILVWDWVGVDLKKESQGEEKDASSIQRRVIDRVLAGDFGTFEVVFDDDGSGEIADVVAVRREQQKIIVELFHCKYSSSDDPGARIRDFYEVCGQAQKCVRWREDPRKFFKRILHREGLRAKAGRNSRFEQGNRQIVQQLLNTAKEMSFEYHVHIVQPGLSKTQLTPAHTDLLGATQAFLLETYSMPLKVIASA